MSSGDSTCWTVLRDAAAGLDTARSDFAAHYAPLVRAYLAARWRGSPLLQELDDAAQEVFIECLRQGGALEKAERDRPGGFRAFLYGVVRNIALRVERTQARRRERAVLENEQALEDDDPTLSKVFDRGWAQSVMRQAADRQAEHAAANPAAQRRLELLRLRFQEDLPIREIAAHWNEDAAVLHHEYARARQEFKAALIEILSFHHPGSPAEVERECAELLAILE